MSKKQTRRQFIRNAGYMTAGVALLGCGSGGSESGNGSESGSGGNGGSVVWSRIPVQSWIVGIFVNFDLTDFVTSSDGNISSVSLDKPLPDGVMLNGTVISGTPTTVTAATLYTVTAGGVSAQATVRVLPSLGGQLDLPLYDTSKIEYLGRFDLPSGGGTVNGQSHTGFEYSPDQGGGGIAYNAVTNSLFITGSTINNDRNNTVLAEISIPTPSLSGPYNEASLLQDYTLACGSGRQSQVNDGQTGGNGSPVTGMLISNGRLLVTVAGLYINNPTSSCMFARPSLDLSDDTVLGPYRVTNINQRIVGNGMGCELPLEWQSVFGGYQAIVGGGGNLSLSNNSCYGPGFHFFNPDDVQGNTADTVPGVNACYYTDVAASGFPFAPGIGVDGDVWNGMSTHRGTIVLPDTRTFIAYGCGGSDAFYDTGGAITGSFQGTYATGGTMNDRFYLYDARDLKDGFDGTESALNDIRPYGTFDMNFCLTNTNISWIGELDQVRSLTFDATNRLAYVHERGVGIHVLRFNA